MRRNKLFSLCVVALLVGALTVPALTAGAAEEKVVARVHRSDTALKRLPNEAGILPPGGFSELIDRILDWVLRRRPDFPEAPPADPPVRPEYVPTIDPSGYRPGRH